jgi:hypothetical protein
MMRNLIICIPLQTLLICTSEKQISGAYSTHGNKHKCIKLLTGKPEGKRSVIISKLRQEDSIILINFFNLPNPSSRTRLCGLLSL